MNTPELTKLETDIAAAVKPIGATLTPLNAAAEVQAKSVLKIAESDAALLMSEVLAADKAAIKTTAPYAGAGAKFALSKLVQPGVIAALVFGALQFGLGWHFKSERDEAVFEKMGIAATGNAKSITELSAELAASRAAVSKAQADAAREAPCSPAPTKRRK